jgi:hypothetical protein
MQIWNSKSLKLLPPNKQVCKSGTYCGLAIAPGRHVIRVQVVSGLAGYNQTKEVEGEWVPEGKKTLEIGFTESGNSLYLALH